MTIQVVPNPEPPIQVTEKFGAQIPMAPMESQQSVRLSAVALAPAAQRSLICQDLLVGDTRVKAREEAAEVLDAILANTQILATYGNSDMEAVNELNDKMLKERPPVNIPELQEAMRTLSRGARTLGRKYNPKDPDVLKRYGKTKGKLQSALGLGKTFLEEFLDDIRSLDSQFEQVIETLGGKQFQLLKNVAYYDEYYVLNEQELNNLIYTIAVMEIVRDLAAQKASAVVIGDSSKGDRGSEEQARIAELVTYLDNRIIAFQGRLLVAWAMSPQIRNMRAISLGLSARIDQTLGLTIPTMKNTIVLWLTLGEAQQAAEFNQAVEDTANQVLQDFAETAKVAMPIIAQGLSRPPLSPVTVAMWAESLSVQADGFIAAFEAGIQSREELRQAIIAGKEVIDQSTMRVNNAQLEHVLAAARDVTPDIARSVPAQG